jgi:hypothetical protein
MLNTSTTNENYNSVAYELTAEEPQSVLDIQGPNGSIFRIDDNGDIYVRGKLTTNDMEVVDGFKDFLREVNEAE